MSLRTESESELTLEQIQELVTQAEADVAEAYRVCKARCAHAKAPDLIAPEPYARLKKWRRELALKLKQKEAQ